MLLSASTSVRLVTTGTGSPEGVLTRDEGAVFVQSDATPALAVLWYKASGSGNTGWVQLAVDTDGTLAADSDLKLATQKAIKSYVDTKVAGLSWKQAVRVATTAAGTLASDFENGDTVDGVVLATGDRLLIKDQASGAENGIYVVAASGAPARAADADSGAELVNATVYISEGTTLADTQWTCTTNAAITVGVTALTFAQLTAGGGGIPQTLLDAKGDLVVASAADTAARLAVGTNGQVLTADSGETTGVKWATPSGGGSAVKVATAYATASDAHTNNSATEDINSMSVSITPSATSSLVCDFDCEAALVSGDWAHSMVRFVLDPSGTTVNGDTLSLVKHDTAPTGNIGGGRLAHSRRWVFTGVTAAAHTVKVQWSDDGTSQNTTFYSRRLTVLAIPE